MDNKPLNGIFVVALEQAVAAPYCSSRLADAGARVVKIERPGGDFARGYDSAVFGESSYFVWINRGKESVVLDLARDEDKARLHALLAAADVFIQNLAPGAAARLGFGSDALRAKFPRLVTCDISGYGESGPLHLLKAYDLLVQAESGLVAVSGAPGPWGRIGVSICDITAGMNALIGVQQALLQRERTGRGSGVKVSLFDSAAELMAVPYLQARYGAGAPDRVGLKHPSIAPYGAFMCSDGREIVLSIQNEREWASFCAKVLQQPQLATDERFTANYKRVAERTALRRIIVDAFAPLTGAEVVARLELAQIANAQVNTMKDVWAHPQLRARGRWTEVGSPAGLVPAMLPPGTWDTGPRMDPVPALGEHTEAILAELGYSPAEIADLRTRKAV